MRDQKKIFLLSAGGTGGHLFPAQALAKVLTARGHSVHLATDDRAERFSDQFAADKIHIISSSTIASKNPIKLIPAMWTLFKGLRQSSALIRKIKPVCAIGFGGYPTIPPMLAATQANLPTILHEQNGVMGRANKLLAGRVKAIAGGFLKSSGSAHSGKIVELGNPVRQNILDAAKAPYLTRDVEDDFNLLVFGGSQGAHFFSQAVPAALELLDESLRARVKLTLQVREEDLEDTKARLEALGVDAEIAPFFSDMAERIANAHLVVSRSGASTVSELAIIGRPAILVPYPYALDHDQAANAETMVAEGGAIIMKQSDLDASSFSKFINQYISDPRQLGEIAQKAKLAGKPDAATRLADLAEAIVEGRSVKEFKEVIS